MKHSSQASPSANDTQIREFFEGSADARKLFEELQASEARWRTLVDHAPEAIVVFDGETGRFIECNGNACRMFGLSRKVLLQKCPWDVSPDRQPDGTPSNVLAQHFLNKVMKGEAPVFDWMHRTSDGRLLPCEVRLVALPGDGRRMVRGSIIDYSERHRRERIQQATYDIADAVLTAGSLEGFYVRVHEIIRRLLPADNFYIALLDPVSQLIHFPYYIDEHADRPEPIPVNTGLTGQVFRTGRPLLVTREMDRLKRAAQGGVIIEGVTEFAYVECGHPAATWLGVPLLHRDRCMGVMAVQDYRNSHAYGEKEQQLMSFVAGQVALAVERKQAEQALRESEQNFRALFETSSQGVMLNDEHAFIRVNEAAARIFGFRVEEIIGKHPRDLAAPVQPDGEDSQAAADRHIERCLRDGQTRFEWLSRRSNGEVVPLDVVLTSVQMDGRPIVQAFVTDISERKRAEQELKRALEAERELSQLKSNFVSMVSHEFRTPLGIIQSSAEILQDYLGQLSPEERSEQVQSIIRNSNRMAGMMEEVLVLGRLDAGKMNFKPSSLDLEALCRRLVDEVLSTTDRLCPIEFHFIQMPSQAMGDERLLRHILINLLTNAVKYSQPGQPVRFTIQGVPGRVEFTIQDRGIGIPESEHANLFTAFHRGSNVGQRAGTGLGLVIVKRCVELHGGTLLLKSRPGDGTLVTVCVPVSAPPGMSHPPGCLPPIPEGHSIASEPLIS